MPTKIIREPGHLTALGILLAARKLPLTVTWTQGAPRTDNQNRLSQRWYSDIARQLGDRTHGNVRAECKLRFGVPILCDENEAFRVSYDRTMGHLTHEERAEAIEAFDLPVTRLMLVKQMTAFMDDMSRFWTQQGIHLTDPEAMKYEEEFT